MHEGKNFSPELVKPLYEGAYGKTRGLLIRMCKSMCRSGKVIILDSVFLCFKSDNFSCVLWHVFFFFDKEEKELAQAC